MKGVAFFSGGKDGLYAVYLAQNKGIEIPYFLILKTTMGLSPHFENFNALAKLCKIMGKELLIFDMKKGSKALSNFLLSLETDVLISGDIFLEEHYTWLKALTESADMQLEEPLWKKESFELARAMIEDEFKYEIIGVSKKKMDEKWLGFDFENVDSLETFVKENPNLDPLGEYGEFHTIVYKSPLYNGREFRVKTKRKSESDQYFLLEH